MRMRFSMMASISLARISHYVGYVGCVVLLFSRGQQALGHSVQ